MNATTWRFALLPDWLIKLAHEFWLVLSEMSPYLLFGFLVAGILSVFLSQKTVEKHLGGRGWAPVVKAALFGVPLPLCSCGVLPVTAALRKQGASKGATTAFLISTPETGVDSILVTLGLLGPVYAIFRPVAAFISGFVGGMAVDLLDHDDPVRANSINNNPNPCAANGATGKIYQIFHHAFIVLPKDIAKGLLFGLFVAGLLTTLIEPSRFSEVGSGIGAMFVMMLIGIPVYVCATAAVPIAAALITAGVSPGAALVFLMTGPATNAAAIGTIWSLMGKKATIIYLLSVALVAIASGLILDYIFFSFPAFGVKPWMPHMLPEWFKSGSAVVLLFILGYGIYKPERKGELKISKIKSTEMASLRISGMT